MLFILVVGAAGVRAQEDGGLWWLALLANSTAPPSTDDTPVTALRENVYCECVPYYLCINGTITTSGAGLLDIRMGAGPGANSPRVTNVEKCPGLVDICCGLPPELTITTTTEPPRPTLPPDTPCECVPFVNCTEEKLVSDGQGGNMTLEILGIGGYWHSKCPQVFSVCCALDPTTTVYPSPSPSPTNVPSSLEECECVTPSQCDENGFIITDGTGLLDIRIGTRTSSSANSCPPPSVCCRLPPNLTTPTPTPTPTTTTTTTPPTTTTTTTQAPLLNCGTRNSMGVKVSLMVVVVVMFVWHFIRKS